MRVDFNVPLDKQTQKVTDDTRIVAALASMNKILNDGGSLVLLSHLGRPKNGHEEKYSLKHIIPELESALKLSVEFGDDCISNETLQKAINLKPGQVLLCENLRFYKEEEKGDLAFAEKLATLGDFYVNDAFGTAHRAHASTVVMAQFFDGKKAAGYLMAAEVKNADRIMKHAERPFTAIVGGAKVSDKILIIEKLLDKVDNLIVGGGMVYTFFKAQGAQIGNSLVENEKLEFALKLIQMAKDKGVKLILPTDSVIADAFSNDAKTGLANNTLIPDGWMGLDIGPESIKEVVGAISGSKTILWNGPMGVFEMEKFQQGTKAVAESIAVETQKGAFSLIGGGDSAAAINQFGYTNQVSYVSTGGGALLEYIEGKELPGVVALQ